MPTVTRNLRKRKPTATAVNRNSLHPKKLQTKNINILNNDCFREIFCYLTLSERLSVACVCKRWNHVIKESWVDVKTLCLNEEFHNECKKLLGPNMNISGMVVKLIKVCANHLKTLKLEMYIADSVIVEFLGLAGTYCKNLKTLKINISGSTSDTTNFMNLFSLFQNNTKLRYLSLKDMTTNLKFATSLEPNIIEELEIDNCTFKSNIYLYDFISGQRNLKKLKFQNMQYLSEFSNMLVTANIKNIPEFYIGANVTCHRPDTFLGLLLNQKRITKLNCGNLIFTNLRLLFNLFRNHSNNLESLSLRLSHLTDMLANSIKSCKNLKELNLSLMSTEEYLLTRIGEKCFSEFENLETIKLSNIKVDEILIALSKCKKLKNIDITNCQFTKKGIKALCKHPNLTNFKASYNLSNNQLKIVHIQSRQIMSRELTKLINKVK